MNGQDSEDRQNPRPPHVGDDAELLTALRNLATEMSNVIGHGRSAAGSLWKAISYLQGSDTTPPAAGPAADRALGPDQPKPSGQPPGNPLAGLVDQVIGSTAGPIVDRVGEGLRHPAAPAAGVSDILDTVVGTVLGTGTGQDAAALRRRGNALIRISHKPECQRRDLHPAFSHILDELVPDEARILRFLGVAGAQPMLDVRTKTLFQIGSKRLLSGVSMVAQMAGCHWPDRDRHYFANLSRLGLVDLSREPIADYRRYALLEVQPAALHVIESVPKSITIYRSVTLTAFGQQFVDVCIDTDGYRAGGWDTDGRQDKIRGMQPRKD